MALPLESVPNVSEGRDPGVLAALTDAFSSPARLLDVHSDWDHHRSVYTLVGSADELPLVPLEPGAEPLAREAALALADRVAGDLELPVFFYGRLAEDGREPAFFRGGGPAELQRRIDAG